MGISNLIKDELFNGGTFQELSEEFDHEQAVIMAADCLRMALNGGFANNAEIAKYVGALGFLGIEIEDLAFVGPTEQNKILRALM